MKTRIHPLLLIVVLLLSNTSRSMAQQNVSKSPAIQIFYSGGSGTVNDPYQIANLTDLRYLSEHSSHWSNYFKQTADIDATATNTWNVGNHDYNAGTPDVAMGFSPIGNGTTNFSGKYDGQSHTISNLYINRPKLDYIGLFGYITYDIRNLGLINLSYVGFQYVGGLAGFANSGTITNTYTKGTIVVDAIGNSSSVFGGLVGLTRVTCTISNSYSEANVSGTKNCAGGLVGINWGTITKCYATGNVSGEGGTRGGLVGENGGVPNGGIIRDSYATGNVYGSTTIGEYFGGLVGRNNNGTINNSYSTGNVTGYNYVGGLNGGNLYGATITNCFWNTQVIATSNGGTGKTTAQLKTQATFTGWDFTTDPVWDMAANKNNGYPYLAWQNPSVLSGGSGSLSNPYKIATLADLRFLSENTSYWAAGKYFIQTADIDATATNTWNSNGSGGYYGFSPIGTGTISFKGDYDGQGHTISNLYINRVTTEYIGLFGVIVNSSVGISNLGLINVNITGQYCVGGMIGYGSMGTFSNLNTTGTVVSNQVGNTNAWAGGLIGLTGFYTTTSSCYSGASVTVNGIGQTVMAAGLIGRNDGTINKCYATGNVSGNGSYRGGLVGDNHGSISQSFATGNVNGSITAGEYFGGLVGISQLANISNCYATGNVTGYSKVGGLVGTFNVTSGSFGITNSYATGAVTCTNLYRGGFIGQNSYGYVTNCFWDTQTTGELSSSYGGTGKTTVQMKNQTTFTNWDFSTTPVWKINSNNNGYPYLAWQNYPVVVPTSQASALVFTSVTNYGMTIGWTNGNGAARAVFVKEGTGAISNPINQTTYTASSDWAVKGTQLASSDYYCVYNGNGNSVSITNLTKNTTYSIQVIEYDGGAGTEVYCTTSGTNNPLSQATTNEGGTGLSSNNATNLILYPNPATEAFRIQGLSDVSYITITDLSGRSLLQKQVSDNEAIQINALPKGIYILKIKNNEGIEECKIIKE